MIVHPQETSTSFPIVILFIEMNLPPPPIKLLSPILTNPFLFSKIKFPFTTLSSPTEK